jgi:hypothetical protein
MSGSSGLALGHRSGEPSQPCGRQTTYPARGRGSGCSSSRLRRAAGPAGGRWRAGRAFAWESSPKARREDPEEHLLRLNSRPHRDGDGPGNGSVNSAQGGGAAPHIAAIRLDREAPVCARRVLSRHSYSEELLSIGRSAAERISCGCSIVEQAV